MIVKAIRPEFLIAETDKDDDAGHAREAVYEEFGNAGLQYAEAFRTAIEGSNKETVTMSRKRYDSLQKDSEWLSYLEAAGADGTSAWEYAQQLQREDNPEAYEL